MASPGLMRQIFGEGSLKIKHKQRPKHKNSKINAMQCNWMQCICFLCKSIDTTSWHGSYGISRKYATLISRLEKITSRTLKFPRVFRLIYIERNVCPTFGKLSTEWIMAQELATYVGCLKLLLQWLCNHLGTGCTERWVGRGVQHFDWFFYSTS